MTTDREENMESKKPKNLVQYIGVLEQKSIQLKEGGSDDDEGTPIRSENKRVHFSEFLKKGEDLPGLESIRTDEHGDIPFASFVFSAEELAKMITGLRAVAFKADHDPLLISHRSMFEDRVRFWMKSQEQDKYIVYPLRSYVPRPILMFATVDIRPLHAALWHGITTVVLRFYPNGMFASFYTSPDLAKSNRVIAYTVPYVEGQDV